MVVPVLRSGDAMPDTALSTYLRQRPADILAVLGLVSGLLSGFWGAGLELPVLQPLATLFFLDAAMLPIGVFYGVAMAIGIAAVGAHAMGGDYSSSPPSTPGAPRSTPPSGCSATPAMTRT